jgi:hypothetical protein
MKSLFFVALLAFAVVVSVSAESAPGGVFVPLFVAESGVRYGVAGFPKTQQDADEFGAVCSNWWYEHDSAVVCAFVPMIRPLGIDGATISADYTGDLMVLNEPNYAGQDTMSACDAAAFVGRARALWPDANIIAPNVSQENAAAYLQAFADCGGMEHVDAVGVHYYAWSGSWRGELAAVMDTAAGYDRPIWVTEFGVMVGAGIVSAEFCTVHTTVRDTFDRYGVHTALWFAPYGYVPDGGVSMYQPLVVYWSEPSYTIRQMTIAGRIQSGENVNCEG